MEPSPSSRIKPVGELTAGVTAGGARDDACVRLRWRRLPLLLAARLPLLLAARLPLLLAARLPLLLA